MLPRSSIDILASAAFKSAPRQPRSTRFDGEILSFSDLALSTAHIDHPRSAAGIGSNDSSQHSSGGLFQPNTMSFHNFGPPLAEGQQGDGRRLSLRRIDVDTSMLLACSVFCLHTNKHVFIRSRSMSAPSVASNNDEHCPSRSSRISRSDRFANAINVLKDGGLSPFDLMLEVLDQKNPQYDGYRAELFKVNNTKLSKILDLIAAVNVGERKLRSLIRPLALEIVCEAIDKEMDSVAKGEILPGLHAISPEFIKSWTVADVSAQAPTLTCVLKRAAQTSLAKEKNKIKHPDAVLIVELGLMHSNTDILPHRCVISWQNSCLIIARAVY